MRSANFAPVRTLPEQASKGRDYWPTAGWRKSTPEEHGLDSELLAQAYAYLEQNFPAHRAIALFRHGYLISEKYNQRPYLNLGSILVKGLFAGEARLFGQPMGTFQDSHGRCWNTRSVTKSVMSILVGLALKEKYLQSLEQKVVDFLPEYFTPTTEPAKKGITLRHLLTMTSGLKSIDQNMMILKLLTRRHWIQTMVNLPLEGKPGERFVYNSANTHLLSAILTKATRMSTLAFANQYLFQPLGIADLFWEPDRQGISFGSGNLFLTPHDMAKIGYLYLNHGLWDGQQITPPAWIQESLQKYHAWDFGFYYGYGWYLKDEQDEKRGLNYFTYSAAGVGGQKILVVPALDLILVATAKTSFTPNKDYFLNLMISRFLIPAVKARESTIDELSKNNQVTGV